jgi:NitT/TauT family transport system permease protein
MNALRDRNVFALKNEGEAILTIADLLVLLTLAVFVLGGVLLAFNSPKILNGPDVRLDTGALPTYALLSLLRMTTAYFLSLLFSILYGYYAARNPHARLIMLPILDILQSTPILSFLPVVVLGLTAILPQGIAVEIGAVLLIFTSQAWNMTYSFYQSMTTIPNELKEASSVFRFNWWWRFRRMELPFSAIGLLWNSVMSWAGGWFFLMAAETFRVGERDFRLPGLGSYLQLAAEQNNTAAILGGVATLILIVVVLDQLVWRPLLAWAEKFKVEMVENDNPPTSWFGDLLAGSRLAMAFQNRVWFRLIAWFDRRLGRIAGPEVTEPEEPSQRQRWLRRILFGALMVVLGFGAIGLASLLLQVPLGDYGRILVGTGATLLRVALSLIIALLWTIPLGVAIGSNATLATILQPLVQIAASLPATAFFPLIVAALITLSFLGLDARLNMAAILLMLLGTQWYILFNVIAGTTAIPQDLRYTTDLLRFGRVERWRKMILPSLFPYLITGLITAGGGAWNASIVAEYTIFDGKPYSVIGLGAIISEATAKGNFPLLAASTLGMIVTVVCLNRYFWRRLYRLAEEKYRME